MLLSRRWFVPLFIGWKTRKRQGDPTWARGATAKGERSRHHSRVHSPTIRFTTATLSPAADADASAMGTKH